MKLILHEYRYEKVEWLVSTILQWLIFTSVFFAFTIANDLDEICGEYIRPLYPDGYYFQFNGYEETDIDKLKEMGFYDITFSTEGNVGYGTTDSLDNIWKYKLLAVFQQKDIWNNELDTILGVLFFCQATFGAIGVVMLIIMTNNLSNSLNMKISRRKRYIRMLFELGCIERICKEIYYGFFLLKNIVSLIMALFTNVYLIDKLNEYIYNKMHLLGKFSYISWKMVVTVQFINIFMMCIVFKKQWRNLDES